jgi:hypothetical protein
MKIISKIQSDLDFDYSRLGFKTSTLKEQYNQLDSMQSFTLRHQDLFFRRGECNALNIDSLYTPLDDSFQSYNKVLVLQTNHFCNYCHCLIDVLPTIMYHDKHSASECIFTAGSPIMDILISLLGIKLDKTTLIYNNSAPKFFNTKSIGVKNEQLKRHTKKITAFKQHVEQHIDTNFGITRKNRLIYCSRNHSNDVRHSRKMEKSNEQAIIELLELYCKKNDLLFTLYTGEERGVTMSHINQLKLFREAKIVVGPHGGAMSNIIYCDPKNSPRICEFTSGTQTQIHAKSVFGKNYSRLNAHLPESIYDYNLIPFSKPSTEEFASIDIDNLKQFLKL